MGGRREERWGSAEKRFKRWGVMRANVANANRELASQNLFLFHAERRLQWPAVSVNGE